MQIEVVGCGTCPFYEQHFLYPTCTVRRQHGPEAQVGEFPHYTTDQAQDIKAGKLVEPEWCLLPIEVIRAP